MAVQNVKLYTGALTTNDTWLVCHQEITETGLIRHARQSMNDLYQVGVGQIMTDVFKIDHLIENVRDKTPQDKAILKIRFNVKFDNIMLKTPVTAGYCSGKEKILMPNIAHVDDRTYSSNTYTDVTVTATAYNRDGTETVRTVKIPNFRLANIPTMVGSDLCNTRNKSREALIELHEDPRDPGGYFIKSGKEWVIDNNENTAFNQERIFNNAWRNEQQRLEFISKPGDTYQNSKQIIVRLLTNGAITIELVVPSLRHIVFPFYLVFRALGWSTDKDIFDHVLYRHAGYPESSFSREKGGKDGKHDEDAGERRPASESDADVLHRRMYAILETAMLAEYKTKEENFSGAFAMHSQTEVLEFLVRHVRRETFKDLDMNNRDHVQQAVTRLLRFFDEDMLTHIGTDAASRNRKLRYIGHFIHRMLYTHLGLLDPTDRDSYCTKRVHTVGISLGKAFKSHFNASIVNQIRKQFIKDFKAVSFASVNLQQTFQTSVRGADFERLLMQSITSATQTTLRVNRYKTIVNRLSSQILDRKNYTKIWSTLRMVTAPDSDSAKNSERAKDMRMPHPSAHGFICYIQSSDHGSSVGLQKALGITASICSYGSGELAKQMVLGDTRHFVALDRIHPYEVPRMAKVFVNGDWIACAHSAPDVVSYYVARRRAGAVHREMTIEWNNTMNEVRFWTDYGRPIRPVVIVYNNMRDYADLGLKSPAPASRFVQATGLTPDVIRQLRAGKLTMDDLCRMRIVEYVTPQEQERLYIACDTMHLKQHENDPLHQFTHVDCPLALLGLAALTCPLGQMNQTPRCTFQTSQTRQTGGVYTYNWPFRVDKDAFLQFQIEQPVVYTVVNDYIPSNGSTVMLAIASYSGYNEEDSAIFNKAMSERMKFNGCWLSFERCELEKNEQFANPDPSRTSGIKPYANYSKLGRNGIVPIGTWVRKGDVIAGKIKRLPKNIAEEKKVEYVDQSLIYKLEFPAIVHNVIVAKDDEATTFCKIAFLSPKPTIIGDKYSSRSGQKCVAAYIMPQSDMMFTESGMRPDAVINPHAFPTRMTMGQIIEGTLGKICAKKGTYADGSMFRSYDIETLSQECKKLGLEPFGRERLYCGLTGNHIDALMFMAPVYYQRLQKFVAKSIYSVDVSNSDILTRAPLAGKADHGGLRVSELQRDVLLAQGSAMVFSEKLFTDCDSFPVHYCRCGQVAIVNKSENIYECKNCGDDADIYEVYSTWASKLFLQELSACHIGCKLSLEPFTFYEEL